MTKIAMILMTSRRVSWPTDCITKNVMGSPASTRLVRTLFPLLQPRLWSTSHIVVKSADSIKTNGTMSTNEGTWSGSVVVSNTISSSSDKPNNASFCFITTSVTYPATIKNCSRSCSSNNFGAAGSKSALLCKLISAYCPLA